MKLLKMKAKDGTLEYMVKLEDDWERGVYEAAHEYRDQELEAKFWDYYMSNILEVEDAEVVCYLMEEDQEPEVGETFELDNMKYERMA